MQLRQSDKRSAMDNQRLLIWSFFGVMLFLTWQAWLEDYGQRPQQTRSTPVSQSPPAQGLDDLPDLATETTVDPAEGPALEPRDSAGDQADPAAGTVRVVTDVLDVRISTQGGTLQEATLLRYPIDKDRPQDLVEMLSRDRDNLGLIQTGVRINGRDAEPNHQADFQSAVGEYRLDGDQSLNVLLTWTDGAGVSLEKTYRFERGSYIIAVEQRLLNTSGDDLEAGAYARVLRRSYEPERSMFDVDSYSFDGPIIYDGDRSRKLDRDDLMDEAYRFTTAGGWVATIQHHFLNAVVPAPGENHDYAVTVADNVARASVIDDAATRIPAAGEVTFRSTLFVGPKLQAQLEQVAESLKLTVDYGWLTIISQPLFWLLSLVHSFVKNWGLAIIVVTILIKLVFYKLTEASGRSMAKMREIQPRMKALQERYKDDRQALSQAMMDLYKREKVNPAAGCLPILIQMPFFLAFYWVLLESVEMRQAPFALWITDLSSRDPFFILPLIMGAAMLFQQKLNPAPADPVQARVMQIMPVVFTGFFAFFPSGLVLYWVTNTVLSIAQQWHINRVVEQESKRRRQGGKSAKSKAKEKPPAE